MFNRPNRRVRIRTHGGVTGKARGANHVDPTGQWLDAQELVRLHQSQLDLRYLRRGWSISA